MFIKFKKRYFKKQNLSLNLLPYQRECFKNMKHSLFKKSVASQYVIWDEGSRQENFLSRGTFLR